MPLNVAVSLNVTSYNKTQLFNPGGSRVVQHFFLFIFFALEKHSKAHFTNLRKCFECKGPGVLELEYKSLMKCSGLT